MDDNNTSSSTSTSTSTGRSTTMLEPKGYALSGKIMLSSIIILFAVVVIMVCLHLYARWYLLRARQRNVRRARRRTHLVFYIDPDSVANPNSNRGLEDSLIKTLPTFVFDDRRKEGECAVCLSEFVHGETGRTLPNCNHCFHVDCIDMWFHSHDTCPLCRAPVMPPNLPPPPPPREEEEEKEEETRIQIGPSLSFGGRGKVIEVPRRCQSFSFTNSDESGSSQGLRSLKRIFSRSPSPLPSPSPSPSVNRAELDVELGQLDPTTPATHG